MKESERQRSFGPKSRSGLLPVRTAAIALAALAKASQSSKTARKQKTASMPSVDVTREALNHHAFALRWYQKAIRSMRGSFEHENPSLVSIRLTAIKTQQQHRSALVSWR
ncbi:hypothetical protein M7I_7954 [Glarea lozoyensis 74030]|uniref:Uncharacterized protein n=1 Tax=Glarea lozoyensis (strain ATCC 74030 / MF5533) TaxID=1104152 RepID=H0EYP7_GLAL7|nr:hypothetical protein M7I_7954 [Glarea lozoyensis 74030]